MCTAIFPKDCEVVSKGETRRGLGSEWCDKESVTSERIRGAINGAKRGRANPNEQRSIPTNSVSGKWTEINTVHEEENKEKEEEEEWQNFKVSQS